MATYVLVPGAWLGGWAWQAVAGRLRAAGHAVYPVTLTGLGERVHLARPEVDLETHIADIVNLIEFEDLRDVVLAGHSYGAVPVTGAADRVPERIAQVVYVDSSPIPVDMAFIETGPTTKPLIERTVAEQGDGWRIPVPSWDDLTNVFGARSEGIAPDALISVRAKMTPQPFGTFTTPLRLTSPAREALPKVGILSSFTEAQIRGMIASGHPMGSVVSGPEWRFVELPTGHWPMFSRPNDLAARLIDIAANAH